MGPWGLSHGQLEVYKACLQWMIRAREINAGWLELETSFMVERLDLSLKGW